MKRHVEIYGTKKRHQSVMSVTIFRSIHHHKRTAINPNQSSISTFTAFPTLTRLIFPFLCLSAINNLRDGIDHNRGEVSARGIFDELPTNYMKESR
jgi:hypothetical protein